MSISYIGSTVSLVAGLPGTFDKAGYEALQFVEIKGIVDMGELGDQQNDIAIDTLIGRVEHVNGSSDLGEIQCSYNFILNDAGQDIVRAAAGTNTAHSFRVVDLDGQHLYFHGILANLQDNPRNTTNFKGETFTIRGNSPVLRTTAPTPPPPPPPSGQ